MVLGSGNGGGQGCGWGGEGVAQGKAISLSWRNSLPLAFPVESTAQPHQGEA